MKAATLYDALGIEPDATPEQIKAAYRLAATKHHPDRGGDAETFRWIKEAFDVLSDPVKRARYDRTGETYSRRDRDAEKALNQLLALVPEAFSRDVQDPVRWIADQIDRERQQLRHELGQIEKSAARIRRNLERFKRRKAEKNAARKAIIIEAVEADLKNGDDAAAETRAMIELADKKLGMLDGLFDSDQFASYKVFAVHINGGGFQLP